MRAPSALLAHYTSMRQNILVAEDDKNIQELLKIYLEKAEFNVIQAIDRKSVV